MKMQYQAQIVVPCYLEEEALPLTAPKMLAFFNSIVSSPKNQMSSFQIIFVDDGSYDKTWEIISNLAKEAPEVKGIKLSRNFGHQAAMLAGLSECNADIIITMDADLQDDINAITDMITAYENGSELVLGVRTDRSSDSIAKRKSANAYYRLLSFMGVNIIPNHADFRLMSKKALNAMLTHDEVNLFLRGIIPMLGFSPSIVPYVRQERIAGETKYTLKKMLKLAFDGITSFSVAPLRLISIVGTLVFILSFVIGCYYLFIKLVFSHDVVPGWASTVLPLLFLGGLQLLSLGVLGEYIGKIYMEVKRRPRFIIQEKIERF